MGPGGGGVRNSVFRPLTPRRSRLPIRRPPGAPAAAALGRAAVQPDPDAYLRAAEHRAPDPHVTAGGLGDPAHDVEAEAGRARRRPPPWPLAPRARAASGSAMPGPGVGDQHDHRVVRCGARRRRRRCPPGCAGRRCRASRRARRPVRAGPPGSVPGGPRPRGAPRAPRPRRAPTRSPCARGSPRTASHPAPAPACPPWVCGRCSRAVRMIVSTSRSSCCDRRPGLLGGRARRPARRRSAAARSAGCAAGARGRRPAPARWPGVGRPGRPWS